MSDSNDEPNIWHYLVAVLVLITLVTLPCSLVGALLAYAHQSHVGRGCAIGTVVGLGTAVFGMIGLQEIARAIVRARGKW